MHSEYKSNRNVNGGGVYDPLVTPKEFCQQGKFGRKTLSRIEANGEGPPAIEISPGIIRYRQSAIDAWFAARIRTGARPAGKEPTAATEARWRTKQFLMGRP
jgi:predicted DNA-binding transcriptional regulator AlpA